MDGLAIFPAMK